MIQFIGKLMFILILIMGMAFLALPSTSYLSSDQVVYASY